LKQIAKLQKVVTRGIDESKKNCYFTKKYVMKFSLISIGKTKQEFVEEGIAFYLKRISKYTKLTYHELAIPGKGFRGSRQNICRQECELLMKTLKGNEYLILLDEGGHKFSSEKFAGFLQHLMNTEQRNVVFAIGGAYGFSEEFRKLATTSISLSSMTFPHQLVRLIFLEQFYRGLAILANDPYHHE
jgi:23S rRNA (pseudouridine1915-N3)-methyltransferase